MYINNHTAEDHMVACGHVAVWETKVTKQSDHHILCLTLVHDIIPLNEKLKVELTKQEKANPN